MLLKSSRVTKKNLKNLEFKSFTISTNRVTKVTTGGRRMSVSVLVVIGDKNGCFGFGLGKALEVKNAENKALRSAQSNLYLVPIKKLNSGSKTLFHYTSAKYNSSYVDIFSAKEGTGIISCPVSRAVFEAVGLTDVVSKLRGSNNPHNVLKATCVALMKMKSSKYYKQLLSF